MNPLFTRSLQWQAQDGTWYPCSVSFGTPTYVQDYIYETQFQLIGFGNEDIQAARGFDPLQSLYMAMCTAKAQICAHPVAPKLNLPGGGLPRIPDPIDGCGCEGGTPPPVQ